MFRVLLESGARVRDRRTDWAALSVLTHTLVIGLAIAGTTSKDGSAISWREHVEPLVYVAPAHPQEARSFAGSPVNRAGTLRDVRLPSTIAIPALPNFDALLPRRDQFTASDIWRGENVLGPQSPGGIPADGVYTELLVERPVVARAGNANPSYPPSLRASGLEGGVIVRFVVDTSGRVETGSIAIVQSTHSMFSDAVHAWLARTRYAPAEVAGRPVRQLVEQRVEFRLR